MATQEIVAERKVQLAAGRADMAKLAQSIGPTGVSVVAVKQQYDEATRSMAGLEVPARIRISSDGSFGLRILAPSAATLLAAAAGVAGGSGQPGGIRAGTVARRQVREVARRKLPELNTDDPEAAERTVLGTARSMGLAVINDAGERP